MLERPISRAGWTRVAFGDVVRKVNDKVDPWDSGLERYVAGEHMDTDDLRIRRWGLIGDDYLGPAFHMRFKPGHVLYGSRRTYLRKVALADFEGITANTTFVLETKDPARLMPELLPFLMQTEAFHSYSIKHSKGSVNPYINFSDLEAFEFPLPPIQEQARLVEAAKSISDVVENHFVLIENARLLKRALILDGDRCGSSKEQIGKLCRFQNGFAFKSSDFVESGIPLLTIKAIKSGSIAFDESTCYIPKEFEEKYYDFLVKEGDILLALTGATTGKSGLYSLTTPSLLNQRVARVLDVRTARVTPVFFRCLLESLEQRLLSLAPGSAQPNISTKDVNAVEVYLPDLRSQEEISEAILALEGRIKKSKDRIEIANSIKSQIMKEAGVV